jgi:hypothetical protein
MLILERLMDCFRPWRPRSPILYLLLSLSSLGLWLGFTYQYPDETIGFWGKVLTKILCAIAVNFGLITALLIFHPKSPRKDGKTLRERSRTTAI